VTPSQTLEKLEFSKVLSFISQYALTSPGKHRILNTLPFSARIDAERAGGLVSEAKSLLTDQSEPPFEAAEDISESLSVSLIDGAMLSPRQILQVLGLATQSRMLKHYFKENREHAEGLYTISLGLFADTIFEKNISKILDDEGNIKDNASKQLSEIRAQIRDKNEELRKVVGKIVRSLKDQEITRDDYITLREGRVVVPVKAEYKRQLKGFIHSESATGQTVYIEPEETLYLNNEIVSLGFAEKRESDRLLKSLTSMIGEYSGSLNQSLLAVAHMDAVFAAAKYSVSVIGSFPLFTDDSSFKIYKGRHPILLKRIGRDATIPFDLELDQSGVLVVTGPNAGGKTVVLKSIGLLSLLAQSGFHVPVDPDSVFRFFHQVFVDIGDAQSIENDLSTFSSHLSNINQIMRSATSEDLVLLDEIGTGTDPIAGGAIATAVLRHFAQNRTMTIASTHHGELKILAQTTSGFYNASMEFDLKDIKPAYRFRQGVPGSSYAFEIAQRIGIPDAIIEEAKSYIQQDRRDIEKIFKELDEQTTLLRSQIRQSDLENTRLRGLTSLYDQKVKDFENQRKKALNQQKYELGKYLLEVKTEFKAALAAMREQREEKNPRKTVQNIIDGVSERINNISEQTIDLSQKKYDFSTGDFVFLRDGRAAAKIVELNHSKGTAVLLIGDIRVQAQISELTPADKSEVKAQSRNRFSETSRDAAIRIDIRGKKPEEVQHELLRFLDDAYVNGIERLEILHGKGTGVLKAMVHQLLKEQPNVKKFYYAHIELGGDGVTVVELN